MSWRLDGFGDDDSDGRERADNMESARSIFPILISFGDGSDAKVGESLEHPFEIGVEVVEGGLDVYEI